MTSTPAERPLLEVRDLYTYFQTLGGMARAIDGVSFALQRGRTLGIVGESGSGKSVLSRTIMDILAKDGSVIHDGEVIFEGRNLNQLSERDMRLIRGREISIVFQDPMSSLNPVMKIGKQITEVLIKRLGMDQRTARLRALGLLDSVGIPDAKRQFNCYPMELSGGMRQRIAIAIAISCEPKLLIADEPTTALDVTIQSQILNLLREQQRERNMSVILITHNLGIVSRYTDDVAVMYAGKFLEVCKSRELVSHPRMPYTKALINSLPILSNPPHSRLKAIPGLPPSLINVPEGCRFHERCPRVEEKCRSDPPILQSDDNPDHMFACWYPLEDNSGLS